jgi:hypothetical protein
LISQWVIRKLVKETHKRMAGWYMPVILVLRKLRQKDHKFKASLGQHCKILSKKQTNKQKIGWWSGSR